ncbi:MAG: hypothetical protein A2Y87_11120, partial [Bacteroidetes bacterium RBG_13_46_8]
IVPLLTVLLFYLVRFNHLSLSGFFNVLVSRNILSSLLSLCVVPNLLVFFIFIWTNMLYLARGVLMATIIFGVIVIIAKYFI